MSKKLDRAVKKLGNETIKELAALSKEELKEKIIIAEHAMDDVQQQLDTNIEYQQLIESKKAIEASKKEVNSRQKAIITYILFKLDNG